MHPHSRGFFAKITKIPLTNAPIRAIIITVADDPPQCELHMESWLSGLRRTTGNRVWAYTPPRVQIPNSPHNKGAGNKLAPLFFYLSGCLLFSIVHTDFPKAFDKVFTQFMFVPNQDMLS